MTNNILLKLKIKYNDDNNITDQIFPFVMFDVFKIVEKCVIETSH